MEELKAAFPFFAAHPTTTYLDSSATTQVPQLVIAATTTYLQANHAAVGRGLYDESLAATAAVEAARATVRTFVNAPATTDVIFTSGATAALNLLAAGLASTIAPGDHIVAAVDNHHANLLPWQRLATERGATLTVISVDRTGALDQQQWQAALAQKPRLVALSHVSNVTGTIHPIGRLTREAHAARALVVVDGAQAVAHTAVDLTEVGCDFYLFSAHKLYGPTGVGCIIADHALLNTVEPWQVGGGMITTVTEQNASWADSPTRHEAGTPNTAGIAGTVAAITWFFEQQKSILASEEQLIAYTLQQLATIPEVTVLGAPTNTDRVGVFSCTVNGRHAHDIAQVLAEHQVAVRAGHHCAQPLHTLLGCIASVRISLGAYSTTHDIDTAIAALRSAITQIPARPS